MASTPEQRIKESEQGMLNCLRNGGGDEVRRIFKESLNDMGIHKDEEQELRKDFNWLRLTRKKSASPDGVPFTLFGFNKNELTIIGFLILIFGFDKVAPIVSALGG